MLVTCCISYTPKRISHILILLLLLLFDHVVFVCEWGMRFYCHLSLPRLQRPLEAAVKTFMFKTLFSVCVHIMAAGSCVIHPLSLVTVHLVHSPALRFLSPHLFDSFHKNVSINNLLLPPLLFPFVSSTFSSLLRRTSTSMKRLTAWWNTSSPVRTTCSSQRSPTPSPPS